MSAAEATAMIGKSVKVVGDLSGSEDLLVEGEVEGTIRLPGARLTLGPAARVRGDVGAKEVVIFGRIDGDVRAPGRVELRSSCVVQGNIYAAAFTMEDNASFRGQIDPSRAGEEVPERSVTARLSAPLFREPAV